MLPLESTYNVVVYAEASADTRQILMAPRQRSSDVVLVATEHRVVLKKVAQPLKEILDQSYLLIHCEEESI